MRILLLVPSAASVAMQRCWTQSRRARRAWQLMCGVGARLGRAWAAPRSPPAPAYRARSTACSPRPWGPPSPHDSPGTEAHQSTLSSLASYEHHIIGTGLPLREVRRAPPGPWRPLPPQCRAQKLLTTAVARTGVEAATLKACWSATIFWLQHVKRVLFGVMGHCLGFTVCHINT